MKFRCPYCKTVIGSELKNTCPQCGKAMKIPVPLQQTSIRERKRIKQRIIREGEHKKRELSLAANENPLKKPAITFTLLMTIAVVGALLVGRSNNIPHKRKRSPLTRATMELRALHIATERFFYDCVRYPDEQENLKALVLNPGISSWHGPYVNIIKPDPWRNKYVYIVSNNTFKVFSAGPDGIIDTDDDIYPYEDEKSISDSL